MYILRYNQDYYIIKDFIPKDKYYNLINSGAFYIKQPNAKFKLAFSVYFPVQFKNRMFKILPEATFIEDDIIKYFFVGNENKNIISQSIYSYKDADGFYIYLSLKNPSDVSNILDIPLNIIAENDALEFDLKYSKKLFLEDYLFNTDITRYLKGNFNTSPLYSQEENLGVSEILTRYYVFNN